MKKLATLLTLTAAVGVASSSVIAQTNSPLTIMRDGGNVAHMFPTYQLAKQLGMVHKKGDAPAVPETPALLYHGGPIMHPNLRFYVVFWQPATLQSGAATTISPGYRSVETNMVGGYEGHSLASISAQYYQQVPPATKRTFITGVGGLSAVYIDTQPYPASGCASVIGPNCITDAQLQTEVQRVITNRGWTTGLDAMFLFFTSSGEGSCFDTSTSFCSTETSGVSPYYCAYHSHIGSTIVYSNEPYGNPTYCLGSGTQPNNASGGPQADPAATAASHEMSESITDPLLNAWYASDGSENGDLCAYDYSVNRYASNTANQYWNGHIFELQTEYNNHHNTGTSFMGYPVECTLVGP